MSASAASMARYMLAHLNEGELDGVRILQQATAEKMQRTLFTSAGTSAGERIGFFSGLEWIEIISGLGLITVIGIITGASLRRLPLTRFACLSK